jgi:hypothetical protein
MSKERLPEPYSRFQAIELRHPSEQYDLIRSLYHNLNAGEAPRPEYVAYLPILEIRCEYEFQEVFPQGNT